MLYLTTVFSALLRTERIFNMQIKVGLVLGIQGGCVSAPRGLSRVPLSREGSCAAYGPCSSLCDPQSRSRAPRPLAGAGVRASKRSPAEGGGDKGRIWLPSASLPRLAAHPRKTPNSRATATTEANAAFPDVSLLRRVWRK